MNKTKITAVKCFGVMSAILVLIALILSIISSRMAYEISNINIIIVCAGTTIVLYVIGIVLENKVKSVILVDIILWITIFLTVYALCQLIIGRLNLMGYVWFSDLESGNPVAVGALNTAVKACVLYFLALISNVIIGFIKK